MKETAKVIPISIRKLKRLEMRPPPSCLFDEPLGCPGDRRFFALYWSRPVLAPVLNDGFVETLGEVDPYRVWRYHPGVMAALRGYNFGDSSASVEHWLLVDRKARVLYVGGPAEVTAVLEYQKRGDIASLRISEPARNTGESEDGHSRQAAGLPAKRYKKPFSFDLKVLHELENWLNENVGGV